MEVEHVGGGREGLVHVLERQEPRQKAKRNADDSKEGRTEQMRCVVVESASIPAAAETAVMMSMKGT